jgi:DME family drug/metabolite transporter
VGAVRVIGGGLLLFLVALRGGALRGLVGRGTRTRCLLAIGAAAAAAYQTAFFAAAARAGVAVGTVVTIGAAPVFAGILSMATGRPARPGIRWLAATATAVAGCAMLVTGGHASGASAAGVALALLASLCYAVYAVTASYLITSGAGDRAVVGAIFGGAAVLLLPVLFTSPMGWVATGRGLAVAAYLAVLTTALAYLFYARGLRTTAVTTATTLGLAEPAIAAVLGLAVLGEHLTAIGLAGLGVLAISLVIAAWPSRRRPAAAGSDRGLNRSQEGATSTGATSARRATAVTGTGAAPASAAPAEQRDGGHIGEAADRGEPVVRLPAAPAGDLHQPGHDHGQEQHQPGDRGGLQVDLGEALITAGGEAPDRLAAPGQQQDDQAERGHDHQPEQPDAQLAPQPARHQDHHAQRQAEPRHEPPRAHDRLATVLDHRTSPRP